MNVQIRIHTDFLFKGWTEQREASVPTSKPDTEELNLLSYEPFYLNRQVQIEQPASKYQPLHIYYFGRSIHLPE